MTPEAKLLFAKAITEADRDRDRLFRAIVAIDKGLAMAANYRSAGMKRAERESVAAARACAKEVVAAGFIPLAADVQAVLDTMGGAD